MALTNWSKHFNPRYRAARQRIACDPYYRFQTLEEVAIAAELGITIDTARATVDDWLRLPGLSIHQARQLVELTRLGVPLLCLEDVAAALSLPVERLAPFAPILAFTYLDPESAIAPARVNPNTATLRELSQIPFLTPAAIDRLVADREANGAYRNLADLKQRLDLDISLLSQLMHYLQF